MPGKRQFQRGLLGGEPGAYEVTTVGGVGSHLVASLGHANCLIVVPEDTTEVAAGSSVAVLALDQEF